MARVSKKKFIEALINNDDNVGVTELARGLNISRRYFYNLREKYQGAIIQAARQIAVNYAVQAVKDLIKQSEQGKTVATTLLLEIAEVKKQESLLQMDGSWRIQIEKIAPEHLKQAEQVKEIGPMTDKG